jgi:CheY-like chemotaxis protein
MKTRILLVEDDTETIILMKKELEVLGYDVTVAQNGVEAVQMAASEAPSLIVMDIRMPKMDGLQAVSEIRKDPKTKDIPILASTALAKPGDKQKCLASGFNGYIAKPFTHNQLGAAIEKLLKRS